MYNSIHKLMTVSVFSVDTKNTHFIIVLCFIAPTERIYISQQDERMEDSMKKVKCITGRMMALLLAWVLTMGAVAVPVFAADSVETDFETTAENAGEEAASRALGEDAPAELAPDALEAAESDSNAMEAGNSEEEGLTTEDPAEPVSESAADADTSMEIVDGEDASFMEDEETACGTIEEESDGIAVDSAPEGEAEDAQGAVAIDEDSVATDEASVPDGEGNEVRNNDGVSKEDGSEEGSTPDLSQTEEPDDGENEYVSVPPAYTQESETGDGGGETPTVKNYDVNAKIKATLKDGVLTVSGSGKMPDYNYSSAPKWLDEMSEITQVVIEDGITHLGDWAFIDADNLESVSLGSVQSIGEAVFCRSGLRSVVIPDTVTSLGYFAFYGCPNLTSVAIGNGVKEIPYQCFYACDALVSIDFGTGVQSMDNLAFSYCNSLETLVLPANIRELGVGAFGECQSLKKVTTKGLVHVAYQAFFNDSALTSVTLNEGITHIYGLAFYGCSSLLAVTTPKSIRVIVDGAFPSNTVITNKNKNLEKVGTNGFRIDDSLYIRGTQDYSKAYDVLKLVNKERKAAGLGALKMDESLLETAMLRAAETVVLFSHTRPDSSECFTANNKLVGENIAKGSSSAQGVMEQWMNSEGHRANILCEDFKGIGIGCFVYNGYYYWVQCFGNESISSNAAQPANKNVNAQIYLPENRIVDNSQLINLSFSIRHDGNSGSVKTAVGRTHQLALTCSGISFVSSKVYWKSSNTAVATVDNNGKLKITGVGTCKITASSRTLKRASITVTGVIDITKASVSGIISKTYTGKVLKPVPTVKYSGTKLRSGTDYTVSYKNNKNVGTATVTITGRGNYAGTLKKTFRINPKGTAISKLSGGTKKFTAVWKKQTAQTTGYQLQYSSSKDFKTKKTVTVSGSGNTSKTVSGLAKKHKYYVRIRTYKTVSGTKYYSSWSSAETVTTK